MIVLGLTGSIGMGKSTTAKLFTEAGIPVHDSDSAVHRLYSGAAVPLVEAAFPGTTADGRVDRNLLAKRVLGDKAALARLEEIVHPLAKTDSDAFLAEHRRAGASLVVLDVPLLFETGGRERVDKILVVTAPARIQKERVLDRPGMTEEKLDAILSRQVEDSEKRRQADFVIDTSLGLDHARNEVEKLIASLTGDKTGGRAH